MTASVTIGSVFKCGCPAGSLCCSGVLDSALKISLRRLRSGQQFDLIPQAFQPSHEPSLDGLAVTFIEVIFTEILIRHTAFYDRVNAD